MYRQKNWAIFFIVLLSLAPSAFAQDYDATIDSARVAYREVSFEKAYTTIVEGIPETVADAKVKQRTGGFLSEIGVEEYGIRNFKNAYDSFRKALKYDPTNAQATSYFLRMRREMNVASLANEAPPRTRNEPKAVAGATLPAAVAEKATPPAVGIAVPATTEPAATIVSPTVQPPVPDVRITELKSALDDASSRLQAMESSVSTTSDENKVLKGQVEQQLKLLQTFIDRQAAVPAAQSKPAVSVPPAQTAQEKALVAQTIELLAKLSEKEAAPPQIVMQSDPALKELVTRLEMSQAEQRQGRSLDMIVVIALIVSGAAFVGLLVFLFVVASRSRKRSTSQYDQGMDASSMQARAPGGSPYTAIGQYRGETPLLEFIDSTPPQGAGGTDLAIRRDLLKADRLNRMYEEVRTGSLGWNTVRQYIGELEVSLRAEILKTVERKLDEGDLISSDAILPVIFPFLTDYDDFVREKSERLARRALTEGRKPTGGANGEEGTEAANADDLDPLSLKNLMDIPRKLKTIFKDNEQSLMTAKVSRGMGAILGLSPEERNLLYKTALAHDCGYLMLDRDRLVRTISKQEIDEEDFLFIQSHVTLCTDYFGEVELPEEFRCGLLSHHERNDGSGYPRGLKKEEIPLFAKLIGVAETFSALVSKRAYRDKRDVTHALAIISDGARSKFDSAHVDALVKVASTIGVS